VQQIVAVRVDDLVAERGGHRQCSAVDHGPWRRRHQRWRMTGSATEAVEDLLPDQGDSRRLSAPRTAPSARGATPAHPHHRLQDP
jgi:hypothetical protein